MNRDQIIHDLAVAYAQVNLETYRTDHPENVAYSEETIYYIKSYLHALRKISEEYDNVEID